MKKKLKKIIKKVKKAMRFKPKLSIKKCVKGDIIIRNLKKKDIPSTVDLQIDSWKTAYKGVIDDSFLDEMDRERRISSRNKNYKNKGFIVAELNKEIVGFCKFSHSNKATREHLDIDCEIVMLHIRPDLKRHGIGSKLFDTVTDYFKNENRTKMLIWCFKDNKNGISFYKKHGGKIVTERTVEIGGSNYKEVAFKYYL